jgi:hypothetical protein
MGKINRPSVINYAIFSALLSFFFGFINAIIDDRVPQQELKYYLLALSIVYGLICILLFFILKGYKWGRFVFSSLMILGFIPYTQTIPVELNHSIALGLLSIFESGLQLLSTLLLFIPMSNNWYDLMTDSKTPQKID